MHRITICSFPIICIQQKISKLASLLFALTLSFFMIVASGQDLSSLGCVTGVAIIGDTEGSTSSYLGFQTSSLPQQVLLIWQVMQCDLTSTK